VEREPEKNRRKEITWKEFDEQANQVANALIARGIKKGDRVVHLMTNCIEWLPIYFGILRTGAWAVPLNFRFVAKTIKRCTETAGAKAFIFGEEFIDRINSIKEDLDKTVKTYVFVGPEEVRPGYAESYQKVMESQPLVDPQVDLEISDEAAQGNSIDPKKPGICMCCGKSPSSSDSQ
jgi:acyl-CoA synthetase (AMP-forming)/AMP-acid ligase II